MLEKCVLIILELNWNQRLGHTEDKIEHLSSYAHVVHTTEKQVISRCRKNENVLKMSKDEKCTCKACKSIVFHCQIRKFVGFLLPSSSWLLPNDDGTLRGIVLPSVLIGPYLGICTVRALVKYCSPARAKSAK